ncbi:hypothetical protein BFM98_20480 [Lysinibacillus sp. AR18-8]|uniref:hypothetical protein n=1 Tax=Lysinibacillus sp. AR18-8 TaxID=1889781 RepID=UPI00082583CE|nr:hypothetical protein [Lysinibacillus sp. AR18-8]OCX60523.1 hypothetical protein BFM98_20480 [Lysinibacillus sp. AR18-8]
MTKRKLYWMLLIPNILIFFIILVVLPEGKKNYSVFTIPIFWIVYYGVLKVMDLKAKKKKMEKTPF